MKEEFCAISKEQATKNVEKLIKANQEVFDEYFMWVKVLQTEVKFMTDEPTDENK
jgi:hypothetical protein